MRAAAAGLCADAAMFHVLAVFLADCAAAFAGLNARAQLCAGELEIGAGEARDDTRSDKANVRTVIAIANALHQLGHVLLAETRIGAGVARLGAGIAGGDALDVNRMIR